VIATFNNLPVKEGAADKIVGRAKARLGQALSAA
jgi:hypothetical protein